MTFLLQRTMDNGCSAALVLLDLSAALDVIDHSILFKRLEHTYGISDCSLAWVKSYLTIGNNESQMEMLRQNHQVSGFVFRMVPLSDRKNTACIQFAGNTI